MSNDRDMSIERTMALYGILFAAVGALGILFFWTIGTVLLFTGNGGFLNDLSLTPTERTLYLSYPVVTVVALIVAGVLFLIRREKEAVGIAGLPVVGTVAFYLALIVLR